MATFTVTTAADAVSASDGVLSLREAVAQANATAAADTIVFLPSIEGSTLALVAGELALSADITIDGDQNKDGSRISIDGQNLNRHFKCQSDVEHVRIMGLDLINGHADYGTNGYDGGSISAKDVGEITVISCAFLNIYSSVGGAISASDLVVSNSIFINNTAEGYGGAIQAAGDITIASSTFSRNSAGGAGGALAISGVGSISSCTIVENYSSTAGGGIRLVGNSLSLVDSTIAGNRAVGYGGGGISVGGLNGHALVRNCTITGNEGGIQQNRITLELANNIITGNWRSDNGLSMSDVTGAIGLSNGHNIFGSDVQGNVAGDRENIVASAIFAAIDPTTSGGQLNAAGIVPLRASVANPALGAADRFAISSTDQIGTPRPTPTGTNPDIGAAESGFAHSKVSSANNDTLTGTAAANTLNGLAGHDFLKSLGGADTLNGGDGGDFLEGGAGNDKLNGNAGIDIANYGDVNLAVTVDLRGDTATDKDTAKRGTETDTLTGIEGAIGRDGNDRFWGDNGANWFQGGGGKDTFTGGAGRDLYDYNLTSASPVGSGRDVITDFDHLVDDIDLMGIDADTTVAGNQAFRWVGKAALTGAGEVGYFTSGGNTIVRMSTDADVASEGEIQLTGIKSLSALDFYL